MSPQPIKLTIAALLLVFIAACSDPRDRTEGTPESLGKYSVATGQIQDASLTLGGYYEQLCVASPQNYERISDQLTGPQLDALMSIHRQLGTYIQIIEREPTTQVAKMADYEVSKHQGYMANLPRLRQNWMNARQRMAPK